MRKNICNIHRVFIACKKTHKLLFSLFLFFVLFVFNLNNLYALQGGNIESLPADVDKLTLLTFLEEGSEEEGELGHGELEDLFKNFEDFLSDIEAIGSDKLKNLPIGIRKTQGATVYDLLLINAVFGVDYTEVDIYLKITSPSNAGGDNSYYFGASGIKMSSTGGYLEEVKLAMYGSYTIKGKGDAFKIVLDGSKNNSDGLPGNYVTLDCDGFKELKISADLVFNSKYIQPVHEGKVLENRDLVVGFSCEVESFDDILVEIDVPEFAISSLPDWSFRVKRAALDLSNSRNVEGVDTYDISGGGMGGFLSNELWTGVFIDEFEVVFPHYIKDNAAKKSPSFSALGFWYDENGVTTTLEARNILDFKEGNIDGWRFSIDKFAVTILQNVVSVGEMQGSISLPVADNIGFKYTARFDNVGKWLMSIGLQEKLEFEFLQAKAVELSTNSYIKIEKKENEDMPDMVASLTGKMYLNPFASLLQSKKGDTSANNRDFDLGVLDFVRLDVSNKKPYLSIGKLTWDKDFKIGIGSFEGIISDINMRGFGDDEIAFGFSMGLNIGTKNSTSASTSIAIRAKYIIEDSIRKWKYAGTNIEKIRVDLDNAILKLKGEVDIFTAHKVYGDGFKGMLDCNVKGIDIGVRAEVMFGSMSTYKYWYADILADCGVAGIPIPPAFKISGFGGGAYQHMRLESDQQTNGMDNFETATGLRYLPDSNVRLGLKAYIVLSSAAADLFTAELALTAAVNTNNGLDHIGLHGVAKFLHNVNLSKIGDITNAISKAVSQDKDEDLEDSRRFAAQEASITAISNIVYDNQNKSFWANFESYMDMGVIKGGGTHGHMGLCEMYFSKDKWYIKFGEPKLPLSIKLDLGLFNIKMSSYIMTGMDLPSMPEMPDKIERLFAEKNLSTQRPERNVTEINGGAGLAFGADLSFTTGDLRFLIFYGKFEAQIGFDIMLKKYTGVFCEGRSNALGLNGWYASGQAYAYLYGGVGLSLKLFGRNRTFIILEGEMAAMLKAQLPKPSYFAGGLALNYSILGGMIKGRGKFEFELGEECKMVESGFIDGQDVIADVKPADNDEKVDVFSAPAIAFNMPIETEIETIFDGEDKNVKIKMNTCAITGVSNEISGKLKWNPDKNMVEFHSNETLPPNTTLSLEVGIKAYEGQNNYWRSLQTIEGGDYQENKTHRFTTGDAPDSIPWANISYTYPVREQKYFYKDESDEMIVKLKKGQAYLFNDDEIKYKKVLYVISASDTIETHFTYATALSRLRWNMPELENSEKYTLVFALRKEAENGEESANSSISESTIFSEGGNEVSMSSNSITNINMAGNGEKQILSYEFSTSEYNTFSDKIADIKFTSHHRIPYILIDNETNEHIPYPLVHYLQADMQLEEAFDEIELRGGEYNSNKPLIQVSALLDNESYYQNYIYPIIYKDYPFDNKVNYPRNSDNTEIIPDWAVYVSHFYDAEENDKFPWIYYLPYHYKKDYDELLLDLSKYGRNLPREYMQLFSTHFEPIRKGVYPIKLDYVLPSGEVSSSSIKTFVNKY